MTQTLPFLKDNKERRVFFYVLALLFSINIFFHYNSYKKFTTNEIYKTDGTIQNIYVKPSYNILKIKTNDVTIFTSISNKSNYKVFDTINLFLITKNISFFSYLKGFYVNSFNITRTTTPNTNNYKERLYTYINSQHPNSSIGTLYSALYLATPLDDTMRDFASRFGISHLIAISGFHLGVISLVLYFLIHPIYTKIHSKYLPYRNKRFDIMVFISVVLCGYLVFLDLPASLLRAFVMFIFALFLLRHNIKIISFETLFIITIFLIAVFPKLLFSLSFWFSISGVFYIFLFLHYFKNLNRYIQILLFNFWIYLAMNPITHYFFATTSQEQLFSPILTLLFTIFYPISVLFHILGIGDILDSILLYLVNYEISSIEVFTPFWLFIVYICISLLAVIKKEFFILLNISFMMFGGYLYLF